MRKLYWFIIFIVIGTAGALGGYYITSAVSSVNEIKDATITEKVSQSSEQTKSDATEADNSLIKTQSEGAVKVTATLEQEKSNSDKLVFEILMDTHSVDLLQYDLASLAEIYFGAESNTQNLVWEPASTDSHHMTGYLTWNGKVVEGYEELSLKLKNIDNIPERVFNWKKEEIKEFTNN